jgi:hypothetical protein
MKNKMVTVTERKLTITSATSGGESMVKVMLGVVVRGGEGGSEMRLQLVSRAVVGCSAMEGGRAYSCTRKTESSR